MPDAWSLSGPHIEDGPVPQLINPAALAEFLEMSRNVKASVPSG